MEITKEYQQAVDLLHSEKCSCVIAVDGRFILCRERGVKDLMRIYTETPELLRGAFVADKIIGKGAAAIMAAAGVAAVYTDLISDSAATLLETEHIPYCYKQRAPAIINRRGTGICPVEEACRHYSTAKECIPAIADTLRKLST